MLDFFVLRDQFFLGINGVIGALNQAVKRDINRFPLDFMFRLNSNELHHLWSQNVIMGDLSIRNYLN